MKKLLLSFLVLVLAGVTPAGAVTIELQGVNYPTSIFAVAEFNYVPTSSGTGEIQISLTNTSTVASSLTGFAFNTPAEVTDLGLFTGPAGWEAEYDPNGIGTPGQFGFFDLAALTGPNFNGGKTAPGIWTGGTALFNIGVTGVNLHLLNTDSFLSLFSDLAGKVGESQFFIARYQAIGTEGGSDVAIPTTPVPEAGTFWILGSGLLGLVFVRRKQLV